MSEQQQDLQTRRPVDRQRPRWACVIHDLGDDLRWALGAWCDFPRPIRRVTAVVLTAVGGHIAGADQAIESLVRTVVE